MRTIIAGSRTANRYFDLVFSIDMLPWKPSVVISGTAAGADRMGERWASENGVPVEKYPADWSKHGKSAGYIRNAEMAKKAEALIALWDGESRGTQHMINLAEKEGLVVHIFRV